MCSFLDQSLLCQEINRHGGNARLIEVPSHLATGKNHHQYFHASMIGPESWNVRRTIIDALAQDKPLARRAFEAMDDARKSLIDDVPRQRPQATNKKSLIEEPLRKRARTCVSSCLRGKSSVVDVILPPISETRPLGWYIHWLLKEFLPDAPPVRRIRGTAGRPLPGISPGKSCASTTLHVEQRSNLSPAPGI